MKKILLNAYINLNFGDDLFLKILFDRYPEIKWYLPKANPIYKTIFKNYNNVIINDDLLFKVRRKLKLTEKNRLISKYDAGLYIGGSIFMQLSNWKEQLAYRNEIIESFNKKQKPYFILGSNFGPYNEKNFIEEYNKLFNKCKDICFRDKFSYDLFKEKGNVRLAPDIVFQLKPKNIEKIKNSVGISLINLKDRDGESLEKYYNIHNKKMKELAEAFINDGRKVVFFSFCENQGDLVAINDVVKLLDDKYKTNIEIVNYDGNIDEFLIKFESMENIVGTRFHACILSQVFNQGLYPILYSNKTYNVLKDIGLDKEYKFIKDLENLDVKEVLNRISNNKITDKKIFKEAEKQFEVLDKYVRS